MTEHKIAAERLLESRETPKRIPVEQWRNGDVQIATIADAYAVQDAMTRILVQDRGQRHTGFKIGATNQAARTLLGVETPFFGRLYDAQTVPTGAVGINPVIHVVAEPEIAVELARDLDPADAPFDAEAIRQATRALLPAIEIIASAFDPWTGAGGPTIIADNGAHGLWVPGEAVTDWSAFDLDDGPILVRVNDAEPIQGRGGAVEGNPFGATAWLANTLAARGEGLAAGALISTGTVVPPIAIQSGMHIHADYGPLGQIDVTFGG